MALTSGRQLVRTGSVGLAKCGVPPTGQGGADATNSAPGTAPINAADVDSESKIPELVNSDSNASEAPKAETKYDDNLLGEAEPEAAMPGFHQEGESDDDEQMRHYDPTDPSESQCPSSDSEEEAADESPQKRGTTLAEFPSKRARMSARALRVG